MPINFHNKTFKVIRNDGPGAEVTPETVFHFRQMEADGVTLLHADYFGGEVRYGKLLGVLKDGHLRHSYVQVNLKGEFSSGQSTDEIRILASGKIQLIDSWEWKTREGRGLCVMEEI